MKTEFQVRFPNSRPTEWITDVDHLRENARQLSTAQLWRRETETPEEAAVRRMDWMEKRAKDLMPWPDNCIKMTIPKGSTVSAEVDRLSPPPQPTETQVDWDTLEPIKEVPVWELPAHKIWISGVLAGTWHHEAMVQSFHRLIQGKCAIGSTRENALRNYEELQSIKR